MTDSKTDLGLNDGPADSNWLNLGEKVEPEISLKKAFRDLLNRHSVESGSDTPDYVLAQYLVDCLDTFDQAVKLRCQHYAELPPQGSETLDE